MQNNLDLDYLVKSTFQILQSLPVTLRLAIIPTVVGILLGLCLALIKIYRVPVLRQVVAVYVSFIRGTPMLVQLFLVYYGLPWILLRIGTGFGADLLPAINQISPEWFALLAFSLNMAAYLSETMRSAIESVDRGQFEAAYSIGLSPSRIMLKIIFPQAALNALPNLGNALISMVKDSSLAFMIMVLDVMGIAKVIGARSLRFLEIYVGVSIIYWVTCIILEQVFRILENKLKVSKRGVVE